MLAKFVHSMFHFTSVTAWIQSYLSGRSQCVRVNESLSLPSPVTSGVPQGSILGPLLFLIFINDLSDLHFPSSVKLFLFADDILLLQSLSSPSDFKVTQSVLNDINNWLTSNLLTVNSSKSKYMFFSLKPQHSFDLFPSLYISNCLLERVYSYKYLGLILTCSLSWSSHISSIKKRSKKILGLIYRHFYPHSSTPVLLSLYKTIVRPILEYASAVWDPHSSSLTASIESVQHFAVKLISKSWSSPYSTLLSALNLATLEHRRKKSKLIIFSQNQQRSLSCN